MAVVTQPTTTKTPTLPYQDPNNPNNYLPLQYPKPPQPAVVATTAAPAPTAAPAQTAPTIQAPPPPQINPTNVQSVQGGFQGPGDLNTQVLQTAQTQSMQGYQSPLQKTVEQTSMQMLQQPQPFGQDYKTKQLDEYNRQLAQQYESARQSIAGASGSSEVQKDLINLALEGVEGRGRRSTELDTAVEAANRESLLQRLASARETVGQGAGIFSQDIANMLSARQTAEGDLNRAFQGGENAINRGLAIAQSNQDAELQTALTTLQGKIQQGLQLTVQDFEATQAALNRSLQQSLQANDIGATRENLLTQLETQKLMQQAGFTNERDMLGLKQNFEGAQAEMNRMLQQSLQSNDINATRENLLTQLQIQKEMQSLGFQFTEAQNAMNRALETSLKTMDIDGQRALVELKGKIDMDQLLTSQDFEGTQAELDRALKDALAKGDWANAIEIQNLQQEFQGIEAQKQREYLTAERTATQSWMTGERLGEADIRAAEQYLQREHEKTLATDNFERQAYLQEQDGLLQIKLQTQEFGQGEKMAYLQSELAEAKANGDVGRQMTLLTFQHGQEMERLETELGHEAAMQYSQQQFQTSLQANDFRQAETILRLQQQFQAEQAAADRVLEEASLKLSERGVNMQEFESTYAALLESDPDAAAEYLQSKVSQAGITLTTKTALERVKEALAADFEASKYQYALSHQGDAALVQRDPATGDLTLTEAGLREFTTFKNTTLYKDDAPMTLDNIIDGHVQATELRGGSTSENPAVSTAYEEALKSATAYKPERNIEDNWFGRDVSTLENPPAANTFINMGGKLYLVTSGINAAQSKENKYQYFNVTEVDTGRLARVTSMGGPGGFRYLG